MLMKYFCCPSEKQSFVNQNRFFFFLFFLLVALVTACSTELEVNAPYRETKVMYAILDPNQPFQTIRVSKGFLSSGQSALDLAKNPDSSLYKPEHLLVELIEKKGTVVKRTFVCTDTIYTTKDTGVFYAPNQMVFKTPNFTMDTTDYANVTYTFRVTNKLTGKVSEAVSNVPGKKFSVTSPLVEVQKDGAIFYYTSELKPNSIAITRPPNAEIVEIFLNWRFKTIRLVGGVEEITYENWFFNSPGLCQIQGGNGATPTAKGSSGKNQFMSFIERELANRESANVVSRKMEGSIMELYFGNKEYDYYRIVNGNYNAITQSTPIYSNVSNGGLGIVAGKNYGTFPIRIDNQTIDTLQKRYPSLKIIK